MHNILTYVKKCGHFGYKSEVVRECNLEQGDILTFIQSQMLQNDFDNKVAKWEVFIKHIFKIATTAWPMAGSEGPDSRKYPCMQVSGKMVYFMRIETTLRAMNDI